MKRKIDIYLKKNIGKSATSSEYRKSILLEGEADSWSKIISAGKYAAKFGYKGVINKISLKGFSEDYISKPDFTDGKFNNYNTDVLIIGGGIIGCSIARELSKYNINILLIDKESDVAYHTSSRNDGMIHPGLVPKPGTKKAFYNVRGNYLWEKISEELDIELHRTGSVIASDKKFLNIIKPFLKMRADKNGVPIEFLNKDEVLKYEPFSSDDIVGGIRLPTAGIVSPYKATVAYAENAAVNGVVFGFNTFAEKINTVNGEIISVETNRGKILPKTVINAAGVYSDIIAQMAGDMFFSIHPRKGQIAILDKKYGNSLYSILSRPNLNFHSDTKGGGLVKTVEGNILVGPSAEEIPYREDYSTDYKTIISMISKHEKALNRINKNQIITYFSGIRAANYEEDFIIEKSDYIKNLIHAAGIQSPGIASAPAVSEEIEKLTVEVLSVYKEVKRKDKWINRRFSSPQPLKLSIKDRGNLILKNPDYGKIICRCEEISRGEIIDALKSPLEISDLDSVKRRTRTGMGRCQGGFCTPLVMQIISEFKNEPLNSVTKKGHTSFILGEKTKEFTGDDLNEKV